MDKKPLVFRIFIAVMAVIMLISMGLGFKDSCASTSSEQSESTVN